MYSLVSIQIQKKPHHFAPKFSTDMAIMIIFAPFIQLNKKCALSWLDITVCIYIWAVRP